MNFFSVTKKLHENLVDCAILRNMSLLTNLQVINIVKEIRKKVLKNSQPQANIGSKKKKNNILFSILKMRNRIPT